MSQPPLQRLLFAGEAIVDLLMWVPALPERGGDMLAESSAVQVGGGFNIMAAAVRQGLPVVYAGGHGTGPWGERVRTALAAEDIDVLRAPDVDADTGFDVALVEADGERTFITTLGAESLHEAGAWDVVQLRAGDGVYVSGYGLVPPGSGPILGAWAAGLPPEVLLFVDPGPLAGQIPAPVLDPVLARCDWWSCNQREGALLTGTSDPAEAARRLAGRTGHAGVIVRAGQAGCVLARRTAGQALSLSHIPAPVVTAVDTTGAGDAHSGVFLAALAAGLTAADAARRANAAAALTVTRFGAAVSPTRAELDQFLARPEASPRSSAGLGLEGEDYGDGEVAGVDGEVSVEGDLADRGDGYRHLSAGPQGSLGRAHLQLAGHRRRDLDHVVADRAVQRGKDELSAHRLAAGGRERQPVRRRFQDAADG
jgi:sugar/nucleoside kinase (ribokinase family)